MDRNLSDKNTENQKDLLIGPLMVGFFFFSPFIGLFLLFLVGWIETDSEKKLQTLRQFAYVTNPIRKWCIGVGRSAWLEERDDFLLWSQREILDYDQEFFADEGKFLLTDEEDLKCLMSKSYRSQYLAKRKEQTYLFLTQENKEFRETLKFLNQNYASSERHIPIAYPEISFATIKQIEGSSYEGLQICDKSEEAIRAEKNDWVLDKAGKCFLVPWVSYPIAATVKGYCARYPCNITAKRMPNGQLTKLEITPGSTTDELFQIESEHMSKELSLTLAETERRFRLQEPSSLEAWIDLSKRFSFDY